MSVSTHPASPVIPSAPRLDCSSRPCTPSASRSQGVSSRPSAARRRSDESGREAADAAGADAAGADAAGADAAGADAAGVDGASAAGTDATIDIDVVSTVGPRRGNLVRWYEAQGYTRRGDPAPVWWHVFGVVHADFMQDGVPTVYAQRMSKVLFQRAQG